MHQNRLFNHIAYCNLYLWTSTDLRTKVTFNDANQLLSVFHPCYLVPRFQPNHPAPPTTATCNVIMIIVQAYSQRCQNGGGTGVLTPAMLKPRGRKLEAALTSNLLIWFIASRHQTPLFTTNIKLHTGFRLMR